MTDAIPKESRGFIGDQLLSGAPSHLIDYLASPTKKETLTKILTRLEGRFMLDDLNKITSIAREALSPEELTKNLRTHVKAMSRRAIDDPRYLKAVFLMNSRKEGLVVQEQDPLATEMGVLEKGRNLAGDLTMFYNYVLGTCLYHASQRLAPEGYILSLGGNWQPVKKRLNGQLEDIAVDWVKLVCHSSFSIGLLGGMLFQDGENALGEMLGEIVNDYEMWDTDNCHLRLPEMNNGKAMGRHLFRFGLEHRVYTSNYPHRIIMENSLLDSVSVITNREGNLALFKVKSPNNQIATGLIGFQGDQFLFSYSSDTLFKRLFGIGLGTTTPSEEFLCALVGSVLRDMYVCEERERFYSEKRRIRSPTRENPRPNPTVIWLPRQHINYIGPREDIDVDGVIYDVAPCDVAGHIRRCRNPDPAQLELARRYGIVVPEGRTFVRPHHRGEYVRGAPDYKSRSALQMLFAAR